MSLAVALRCIWEQTLLNNVNNVNWAQWQEQYVDKTPAGRTVWNFNMLMTQSVILFFLTEYACGGSLYDYLSSDDSEKMDMGQILTWSAEIARGK